MMSPVAAANPHASALPLPLRVLQHDPDLGRNVRATSTVSSVE